MKTTSLPSRWVIAAVLLAAGLILTPGNRAAAPRRGCPLVLPMTAFAAETAKTAETNTTARPRLMALGAGKCVSCKAMAPILKELKAEYAGRMDVEFIDVWKNPDAAKAHSIKLIPTQICFDAAGKERFRHMGFFSKKDILAKWKELGVEFTPAAKPGAKK